MTATAKPEKPQPDFPLFPHASGKWAKKIDGKLRYFGRWEDPEAALAMYHQFVNDQAPSGPLQPPTSRAGSAITVKVACELFLQSKNAQVTAGSMAMRTFNDYCRSMNRFAAIIGADRPVATLSPVDFGSYATLYAKTNNPVSVGNEITRIKTMLKWLHATQQVRIPVDTGPDFRKPSARIVRRLKRQRGKLMFTPPQIHALLDESGLRMRAMILLGINCGYQNDDCVRIPVDMLRDAASSGWLDNARHKSEVDRRCHLWGETKDAITRWLDSRPRSEHPNGFVLADGRPLSPDNGDVAKRFRAVRDAALIRRGGFSWLRKTFATVGGLSSDQAAVNFIMGHVDATIPGVYRQEVQDERLLRVSAVVRDWLF